ncbi:hypothetical protein Pyn_35614 [Prunus yedoensis var. nudiflora]|uniref:Uncharacterized protein n=1 Tax=Prunus yedoensis var. nudiflora TaxID=2094558 RepID=A0A314ULR4_PRUYE|nr:hypothetical protein Pyn_35614 [Prunus yedoensis var. nudiflora]
MQYSPLSWCRSFGIYLGVVIGCFLLGASADLGVMEKVTLEERSRADVFPIFGEYLFLVEDRWVSMCSNADLCGGGVSPPLWPLWYGLRPLCGRRWLCIVFWFDFVMGKTIILDCTENYDEEEFPVKGGNIEQQVGSPSPSLSTKFKCRTIDAMDC